MITGYVSEACHILVTSAVGLVLSLRHLATPKMAFNLPPDFSVGQEWPASQSYRGSCVSRVGHY